MFELWFLGDKSRGIRPYRLLKQTFDFTDKEKAYRSKANFVMNKLISMAEGQGYDGGFQDLGWHNVREAQKVYDMGKAGLLQELKHLTEARVAREQKGDARGPLLPDTLSIVTWYGLLHQKKRKNAEEEEDQEAAADEEASVAEPAAAQAQAPVEQDVNQEASDDDGRGGRGGHGVRGGRGGHGGRSRKRKHADDTEDLEAAATVEVSAALAAAPAAAEQDVAHEAIVGVGRVGHGRGSGRGGGGARSGVRITTATSSATGRAQAQARPRAPACNADVLISPNLHNPAAAPSCGGIPEECPAGGAHDWIWESLNDGVFGVHIACANEGCFFEDSLPHDHVWKWVDAQVVLAAIPQPQRAHDQVYMMYRDANGFYQCGICGGAEVKR